MDRVHATIAGRRFQFDQAEIRPRLRRTLPEPLDDHYVVVEGQRFPPKQIVGLVTGLDRADFNSHQARRILSRLGFAAGRRSADANRAPPSDRPSPSGREADLLRPFRGKWVAHGGLEVLVAADDPEAVISWLESHNQHAGAMFRVPLDEAEVHGAGPG